jgi:hypothetical protein
LLIDSTHKTWFWTTLVLAVAALGLYFWINHLTPGGLTGGSLTGLWYGLIGSALMIYAGALSLLRRVPSWWWIGSRQTWLRGHIWLGLLSAVFILCHSGFRWGGPLELILMIVVVLVLATGIGGLLLQQVLPRMITLRVAAEAPYEQIPYLCTRMSQTADDLMAQTRGDGKLDSGVLAELEKFYHKELHPFLGPRYDRSSALAHPLQAEATFRRIQGLPGLGAAEKQLNTLRTLSDERRQLGEQERLHLWLHGWLLVHVPLSVMLLVLGLAHAVMSLYY